MPRISASCEPPPVRGDRDAEENDGECELHLFRQKAGFLGIVGIAFTCGVFLMTLLRPVLEPFLWALFLVIALHPVTMVFEGILQCMGRSLCGVSRRKGCILRGDVPPELELEPVERRLGEAVDAEAAVESSGEQLWRVAFWGSCCECLSRIVAVSCALAVVSCVAVGVATFIFEGAIRLKENSAIYEKGARSTLGRTTELFGFILEKLPEGVKNEISENALSSAKAIASELVELLLQQAGKIFVELLMLGLYVMFWLCTPMPLNTDTERIFRCYMFLKGSACICYGLCVGVMLRVLQVELAAVFGLMSSFLSFIPEVGAFFAMILPMPVILFDSRLDAPFLTLLIAMLGQLCLKFVFANIIEVKLVENDATMKMHPVITLLAVTFFGFIWGPTGMLLSVPMMAYLKVALLSDRVPSAYGDPVLIMLEGDRRAPERHRRRARKLAAAELATGSEGGGSRAAGNGTGALRRRERL